MKTYILKPTMTRLTLKRTATPDKPAVACSKPPVPPRQPLPRAVLDPAKPALKLGLDAHLESTTAVAQKGHASLQAPRPFTRGQLVEQVRKWVVEGFQVFCVQESCGFGFTLHRQLVAAGAQSFLITPVALNGKRKTDKLDARALCQRLSRWWGARNWPKLAALDPWLHGELEKLRHLILELEAQLEELETELTARVKDQPLPKGLGALTVVTLDGEVCDWGRFNNRKQIGSYTGCCPGEHSSGGKRRVGSIDRLGNGRVRCLLVEAVWRFLPWQPQWHAAQRMKVKLAEGSAMKKKTVVALARLLAIDLWRWRTGRATFADLGWVAA